MLRFTTLMLFAALLTACSPLQRALSPYPKWAVYYNNQEAPEAFSAYNLLVLDDTYHPDLSLLKKQRITTLGYVSISEVRPEQAHYQALLEDGHIVRENEQWNSGMIDIRQKAWQETLINEVIPSVLEKGFDGIMLDTADSALELEEADKERYQYTTEALIYLIKMIRYTYPNIKIMINRGFEILPEVGESIDYVLAESILSEHNHETGESRLFPDDVYKRYAEMLHLLQQKFPHLRIYTLDYWPSDDKSGKKKLYDMQRLQGFIPYVSTPDLRSLHKE